MKTRFIVSALFGVTACALLLACAGSFVFAAEQAAPPASSAIGAAAAPAGTSEIVAKVNGSVVTQKEFDRAMMGAVRRGLTGPSQGSAGGGPSAEMQRQILNSLVDMRLLLDLAKEAKIEVSDADVNAKVEEIKKQFPSEELLKENLASQDVTLEQFPEKIREDMMRRQYVETLAKEIKVSDDELRSTYDEMKAKGQMTRPEETVDVAHILVMCKKDADEATAKAAKDKIDAAYKRVTEGKEDFGTVAKEVSEDPGSKDKGGAYPDTPKGQMVPEFEKVMFETPVGQVSQPFQTEYGWHIVKVNAKHQPGEVTFDEVKDRLLAYMKDLRGPKFGEIYKKKLEEARAKAKIEILYTPKEKEAPAPAATIPMAPVSSTAATAGGGA